MEQVEKPGTPTLEEAEDQVELPTMWADNSADPTAPGTEYTATGPDWTRSPKKTLSSVVVAVSPKSVAPATQSMGLISQIVDNYQQNMTAETEAHRTGIDKMAWEVKAQTPMKALESTDIVFSSCPDELSDTTQSTVSETTHYGESPDIAHAGPPQQWLRQSITTYEHPTCEEYPELEELEAMNLNSEIPYPPSRSDHVDLNVFYGMPKHQKLKSTEYGFEKKFPTVTKKAVERCRVFLIHDSCLPTHSVTPLVFKDVLAVSAPLATFAEMAVIPANIAKLAPNKISLSLIIEGPDYIRRTCSDFDYAMDKRSKFNKERIYGSFMKELNFMKQLKNRGRLPMKVSLVSPLSLRLRRRTSDDDPLYGRHNEAAWFSLHPDRNGYLGHENSISLWTFETCSLEVPGVCGTSSLQHRCQPIHHSDEVRSTRP